MSASRTKSSIAVKWSVASQTAAPLKAQPGNALFREELALNKINSGGENDSPRNPGHHFRQAIEDEDSDRREQENNAIPEQCPNDGRGKATDSESQSRRNDNNRYGDRKGNAVIDDALVNELVLRHPCGKPGVLKQMAKLPCRKKQAADNAKSENLLQFRKMNFVR